MLLLALVYRDSLATLSCSVWSKDVRSYSTTIYLCILCDDNVLKIILWVPIWVNRIFCFQSLNRWTRASRLLVDLMLYAIKEMALVPVLAFRTISVTHTRDADQNAFWAPIVLLTKLVWGTSVKTHALECVDKILSALSWTTSQLVTACLVSSEIHSLLAPFNQLVSSWCNCLCCKIYWYTSYLII